ncbi:MAG: YgiT-type zinc finger protein [Aridibacter sp.]
MKSSIKHTCKKFENIKLDRFLKIFGKKIFYENIPAEKCLECGEIYIDGMFLIEKEKEILDQKVAA